MHWITEENYAQLMQTEAEPYLAARRETGLDSRVEGEAIYFEHYRADAPKGVIVISHGFTESVAKFTESIYYMLQAGYEVWGFISRRIGSIWVVISMSAAIVIGLIGFAMSSKGIIAPFESSSAAEAILVRISALMSSYGILPALLAGIVLAGILSSTMSTADAQLLAAASGVSHNILKGVFRLDLSSKQEMTIARIAVLSIALIAVFFARDPRIVS